MENWKVSLNVSSSYSSELNSKRLGINFKKTELERQRDVLKMISEIKFRHKDGRIPLGLIRTLDLEGVEKYFQKMNSNEVMVKAAIKIQSNFRAFRGNYSGFF